MWNRVLNDVRVRHHKVDERSRTDLLQHSRHQQLSIGLYRRHDEDWLGALRVRMMGGFGSRKWR
jgi:hypothetical protein